MWHLAAHVSFAMDVNEISSSCSDRTSSAVDSSGGAQHSTPSDKPTVDPENKLLTAPVIVSQKRLNNNNVHSKPAVVASAPPLTKEPLQQNGGSQAPKNGGVPRQSTSSINTSDYFSMNSKESDPMVRAPQSVVTVTPSPPKYET